MKPRRLRGEWIYQAAILALCGCILWQVIGSDSTADTNSSLNTLFARLHNSAYQPVSAYSLVVFLRNDDCTSCLGILSMVNRLQKSYSPSQLDIMGMTFPGENGGPLTEILNRYGVLFPVYTIPEKFRNRMQEMHTPMIILFDREMQPRFIQPPVTSAGEQLIFYQVIELLI